jgi:hypothetical protein
VRETIQIIDAQTGAPVDAEIFDEVALAHFMETQAEWRPVILAAARALSQQPNQGFLIPRHFHWDWTRKEAELKLLAVKFYGLACEGKLQGIMKVETVAHACRLPEQQGKPLVYIDYVESAPWNIKKLMGRWDNRNAFGPWERVFSRRPCCRARRKDSAAGSACILSPVQKAFISTSAA